MTSFENQLNRLLVKVYRSIEVLEEEMLQKSKNLDLSINEIHLLEAVAETGREEASTISKISDWLEISLPSVTMAVNKLAKKGYLEKHKCAEDGRVVQVILTKIGRRAEHAHRYFHRTMVRSVTDELTGEDQAALLKGIGKLDAFLDQNIRKYRELP